MKYLVTALLLASRVAYADTDPIVRKGFTLSVGLGSGGAYYAPAHSADGHEPGIAINFMVGGFVRPQLAILYHQLMIDSQPWETALEPGISAAATLAAQYWLGDRFHLIGGLGLGIVQFATSNPFALATNVEEGLAIDLGFGVLPIVSRHHALSISVELAPIVSDHLISNIYSASVCWQYY